MYRAAEFTEIQRNSLHFILHIQHIVVLLNIFLAGGKPVSGKEKMHKKYLLEILLNRTFFLLVVHKFLFLHFKRVFFHYIYTKKCINIFFFNFQGVK